MEGFLLILLIVAIALPVLALSGVVSDRAKSRRNSIESTMGKVIFSRADLVNKEYKLDGILFDERVISYKISFIVDGTEYIADASFLSSKVYHEGDEIEVHYNPDDPNENFVHIPKEYKIQRREKLGKRIIIKLLVELIIIILFLLYYKYS